MQTNFELYEIILNHMKDLVYVLDGHGNYIYVTQPYCQMVGIPEKELLFTNVHRFIKENRIDLCVSDIVYRDKKEITMFQDVYLEREKDAHPIRYIITSTPILDEDGNITHVVAVMKSIDNINAAYLQAGMNEVSSVVTRRQGKEEAAPNVIAVSDSMKGVLHAAKTIADVDAAILVYGESGTGKEVVAHFVHKNGKRSKHRLVTINCASLPENLLESELFGYVKGAFTSASEAKTGLIQEADRGTLFLDEINSLPFSLQGKLLRVLETKVVRKLGSTKDIPVDFRIIAASNDNLKRLVDEGRFRSDLYYRLNVLPITIPALRERREDIVPLAEHFAEIYGEKYDKKVYLSETTRKALQQYDWPGNVRELKNFIERLVVLANFEIIDISVIDTSSSLFWMPAPKRKIAPVSLTETGAEGNPAEESPIFDLPLDQYMQECEKRYLKTALKRYGSTYKTAEAIRTSQANVFRKKKKYDL